MEAEQRLFEGSMDAGYIIMVVEAGTRVARAESGIMNVTEAVEGPSLLIQMLHSIINSKNTENVT